MAFKAVKLFVNQSVGDFTGAVRAKVHGNDGISIFNGDCGFSWCNNGRCLNKFVIFITTISSL